MMDEERVSSLLERVLRLRQLPALDLRGCRMVSFQTVRATCLRVRMVRTLWNRLTTRKRRALLSLLCVKSGGPSQARWWRRQSVAQSLPSDAPGRKHRRTRSRQSWEEALYPVLSFHRERLFRISARVGESETE